ncbi:MAG: glycosyltransferase [Christensenellales bacterium]
MKGFLVSVAMCTYNGERYIREQIISVLNQTSPIDEIVICDDLSDDRTCEIIELIRNEYKGKRISLYRNEKRLGIAQNFFKAMHLCSGDIIFLCDQDDVWMEDKVATYLDVFRVNARCNAVLTDAVLVDEGLKPLEKTLWESLGFSLRLRKKIQKGQADKVLGKGPFVTGAALAVRKTLLQNIVPPIGSILHDEWLGWFINNSMAFAERPTFYYRQHDVQAVGAHFFSGLSDHARYLGGIVKMAEADKFPSVESFQSLATALEKAGIPERIIRCIKGKISFMIYRSNLPPLRAKRFLKVLLNAGLYCLYANSIKGVIKDIIRKIDNDKDNGKKIF